MVDNKYDIVGIGNSIVDVITDVEDQFLNEHELRKGLMSLVDLDGIKNISEKIDIKKTVSGGSVANSIVALAQNNMKTAFIGKVGIDKVGNAFVDGLNKENVFFANVPQSDESETGRCLVMVTPDAQRTMSTYLGISQKLNSDDVNEDVISQSKITYLEGYLWDLDDAQVAIKKATKVAKENNKIVAFSVSDVFCIERFKESFLSLINEEADIIFANEEEIKSLLGTSDLDESINIIKDKNKIFAITLGENGAMIINNEEVIKIEPQKIDNLVDTTGAGDLFAAGFLLKYIQGQPLEECGKEGVRFASKVIQIYGARL
tara:strand:- start:580 stop:1533 length:954 start_codon:yes stop_codon:yes gene_type:complete